MLLWVQFGGEVLGPPVSPSLCDRTRLSLMISRPTEQQKFSVAVDMYAATRTAARHVNAIRGIPFVRSREIPVLTWKPFVGIIMSLLDGAIRRFNTFKCSIIDKCVTCGNRRQEEAAN